MLLLSTTDVCLTWHAQFLAVISKNNPYFTAINYGCRCNMDSFLLNQKGLEEVSILPNALQGGSYISPF